MEVPRYSLKALKSFKYWGKNHFDYKNKIKHLTMTSSTLGEAADMDCPNQKEWRAKKLKGHLQSYPLAGPGSQGQLLEEDWGAVGKQQPQFLTIEKHPRWRQRPGWWENILGMNHYKLEDFKGKKAIHFTVSSRQQKGERGERNPAPGSGSASGRWAVVSDECFSSLLCGFLHKEGETTDSWDPSRGCGYMREVCLGVPVPWQ